MQETNRTEADWLQPFPASEYQARRRKVEENLKASGFDAILVTNPADLYYLTGYDMIWFHLRYMTSCILTADPNDLIFLDYPGHQTLVETTPEIRRVTWMTREDAAEDSETIASTMIEIGLKGKRVALQRWGYTPHADIMDCLSSVLRKAGMVIDDGSRIVEEARLYKTPLEVTCLRESAAIADTAMCAARDMIAPGVKETALQAAIMHSMMNQGGGDPGIRCMIGSGPRAGTHHSPAQHREIRRNELIFIDFCASLHRYHVNLNRTFVLGQVDARWTDLMDRAAGTIDEIVSQVGPGDDWSKVQEVADKHTDASGIRDYVWFVGGYALGIAMPPDWVGEYWVNPLHGLADRSLEPGMVFNFEGQFDDKEGWQGGSGAAYIESLLVTENGLEVMSRLPRTLVTVGA